MRRLGLATSVLFAGLTVTGLVRPIPAEADQEVTHLTQFTSPSGNIGCAIIPAGAAGNFAAYARCDIQTRDWTPPPRPSTCPPSPATGRALK